MFRKHCGLLSWNQIGTKKRWLLSETNVIFKKEWLLLNLRPHFGADSRRQRVRQWHVVEVSSHFLAVGE